MGLWSNILNRVAAAALLLFVTCGLAAAQDTVKLDELFTRLLAAPEGEAGRIETEIWIEWSKSGSPAMDLLLQRGRDAMALGENKLAVEHFTAIIDHSPGFAEAWNARATAYFNLGDYGPSVADIAQVLTLNPRHFGALSGLAMILEESGSPDRALAAYKAALALHPHLQGVKDAIARLEAGSAGQEL